MQFYVCGPFTQCRVWKTTRTGGGARPAGVMLYGCLDDAHGGGRRSMSDGFSLYVIIVLEISGPWLSGI
jgi:hypothetical protein